MCKFLATHCQHPGATAAAQRTYTTSVVCLAFLRHIPALGDTTATRHHSKGAGAGTAICLFLFHCRFPVLPSSRKISFHLQMISTTAYATLLKCKIHLRCFQNLFVNILKWALKSGSVIGCNFLDFKCMEIWDGSLST